MVQKLASDFFNEYLHKKSLFKDHGALSLKFTPDNIPHREHEISLLAQILAPALKIIKPSNVFIYGKPGTGKTLVVKNVISELNRVSSKNNLPLKIIYLNCKMSNVADTEYRIIAQLTREFGKEVPITGLPTSEIYREFFDVVDEENQVIILVLDEIDFLVNKCGDSILYNLTRINEDLDNANLSIVGISNDIKFTNNLEPRVKSSLGEEEILFSPYDAIQLKDILEQRANMAFNENAYNKLVISKCSAYAAQQHGDARRAIDLLRVAGELAERKGQVLTEEFVDMAEKQLEKDRVLELVKSLNLHSQLVLHSIILILKNEDPPTYTGDTFDCYKKLCVKSNIRPLTQRRVSDLIGELDMMGLINAQVISKGRYGRTREIDLAIDNEYISKVEMILCE